MDLGTKLNKNEEKQFRDWYKQISKKFGLDPNPDDEGQYYDYRGFWKYEDGNEVLNDPEHDHFIDRYKLPNHPTFSNEFIYSGSDAPGGVPFHDENRTILSNTSSQPEQYLDRASFAEGGEVKVPYRYEEPKIDNYDIAYGRLIEGGFTPTQAIGVLANLEVESGGLKNVNIENSIGAHGVQQWLGSRKQELFRRYGNKPTLDNQIDFLIDEHKGRVKGAGWNYTTKGKTPTLAGFEYYQYSRSEFENAPTVEDATLAWNQGFGRPKKFELNTDRRLKAARRLAERYGVSNGNRRAYDVEGYYRANEPKVLADNSDSPQITQENIVNDPRRFPELNLSLPPLEPTMKTVQPVAQVAEPIEQTIQSPAMVAREEDIVPLTNTSNSDRIAQEIQQQQEDRNTILKLIQGLKLNISPISKR